VTRYVPPRISYYCHYYYYDYCRYYYHDDDDDDYDCHGDNKLTSATLATALLTDV
jgi:hypothetical protein